MIWVGPLELKELGRCARTPMRALVESTSDWNKVLRTRCVRARLFCLPFRSSFSPYLCFLSPLSYSMSSF